MDRDKYLLSLRKYWIENEVPNITDENALFLGNLIKTKKPQNMLEIWTANGYSAIIFWIELEKNNWKLDSIEFSTNSHSQAKENIINTKLESTVNLILWNALDEIPKLEKNYDFVFIDWMKRRSLDFLKLVWDKVPKSWIIIIDDVIKFRDKMIWLWDYLKDKNIKYSILPIDEDDWILMIVK